MNETTNGDDGGMATAALGDFARLYQAALIEVLMRDYRWTAGAASRAVALVAAELQDRAGRAAAVRRAIDGRRETTVP